MHGAPPAAGHHKRPLDLVEQIVTVAVKAIAHAGLPGILNFPRLTAEEDVYGLQEAHVDGRAAESVVGQVDRGDLAHAEIVKPVQFLADQFPGAVHVALALLVQILRAVPVAQRVNFHAEDDGQAVFTDDFPGFFRRIGDLEPAASRAFTLRFHERRHLFHRNDLPLDGALVIGRQIGV